MGSMDRHITTYERAIDYLYGRINYERAQTDSYTTRDFKLDRMRELLARLDNPHETLPAVHIAGTKGKGTTAVLTAKILEAAGYRVGLFTSPHIYMFEERIQINGQMPAPGDIVSLVREVADVTDQMDQLPGQMSPTFFEITMAIAWLWFRDQGADWVVLEVGLGGRLDATNVCRPVACAITSISRDHTGLLGSTTRQIAAEKAGIVKPGIPTVCGVQDGPALQAIETICDREGSELILLDRDIRFIRELPNPSVGTQALTVQTPRRTYKELTIPFVGSHQLRNTAVAVGLIECLVRQGCEISEEAVRRGLASARCPLRIEVVQTPPTVVLDVAHNWASVAALLNTLNRDFPASHRVLIFAASRDKDVSGMLRQLLPQFDSVILTQFLGNPRSWPVEKIGELATSLSGRRFHQAITPAQAWQIAQRLAEPQSLICGTGSFFIAAEIREVILGDGSLSLDGRGLDPAEPPPSNKKAANPVVDGLN